MVASEGPELKLADVVAQVQLMGTWIVEAAKNGTAAHDVERQLFRSVLKWGLAMLKGYFELTGSGDLGETFTPRTAAPCPAFPNSMGDGTSRCLEKPRCRGRRTAHGKDRPWSSSPPTSGCRFLKANSRTSFRNGISQVV